LSLSIEFDLRPDYLTAPCEATMHVSVKNRSEDRVEPFRLVSRIEDRHGTELAASNDGFSEGLDPGVEQHLNVQLGTLTEAGTYTFHATVWRDSYEVQHEEFYVHVNG
jgi:hypothetical protein